jgi:HTH-type transcriptional regulator/antitoxin HigA
MHRPFEGLEGEAMDIKPIKTEQDYRATLQEIESLMNAEPGSPEGERLDILVTLLEAYEQKHFPMDLPDPVEAIKFVIDQRGLTVKDLEPMIGRPNRVYEVLSHKRPLTLKMIWRLHKDLRIPAECLIKQPEEHQAA